MNKTVIALSLAFAASAGAFTAAQAGDGFQRGPDISGQPNFVAGVVTDLNADAGVDYTATASIRNAPQSEPMSEQMQERLYAH